MKLSAPSKVIIFVLLSITLFAPKSLLGQSQSGCTITFPNNFDNQVNISSIYDPSLCPSGDLVLSNLNDKNGVSTVTFDTDITLNSLTLNYKAGNNPLEIIVASGVTVNIANDLTMNLTSTVQDKYLTIDGTLIVGGVLDFGNINMEIDGTGTINAGTITGGGNTTCSTTGGGTGTCPSITAASCADPSGLCTEPGTVTPIELMFFNGEDYKDGVLLTWATASEENFNHFEVEKAHEGGEFESIASIAGSGRNSYHPIKYEYIDINPELGFNYYRLRSVDNDGSFDYSDIILVKFESGIQLQVSPNPSNGLISVKTNLLSTNKVAFVITNQLGTLVYQSSLSSFNNTVDLTGLRKGIYIIKLLEFQNVRPQRIVIR